MDTQELKDSGFSDGEINTWVNQRRTELSDAGFSSKELDDYFKPKPAEPDMSPTHNFIKVNFHDTLRATPPPTATEKQLREIGVPEEQIQQLQDSKKPIELGPMKGPDPEGKNFIDAFEAGFQRTSVGLGIRQKLPDKPLPAEDAPLAYKIAANIGMLAGDAPAALGGYFVGGAIGGTIGGAAGGLIGGPLGAAIGGGIGEQLGQGFGIGAFPAGLRRILMDHYEKGDIKDFQDFWARASGTFIDSYHAGLVSMGTLAMGGLVSSAFAPTAMPLVKASAQIAAETAFMTVVGKALDKQVPSPDDFIVNLFSVAGMHLVGAAGNKIISKMRNIYAETGLHPSDQASAANGDVTVKQDLLSLNIKMPKAFEAMRDNLKSERGSVGEPPEEEKPKMVELPPAILEKPEAIGGGKADVKVQAPPEPKAEGDGTVPPPPSKPPSSPQDIVDARFGEYKNEKPKSEPGATYTALVDRLHPLERFEEAMAGKGNLKTVDSPYKLARLMSGNNGRAYHYLRIATYDFNTLKNNGPPLEDIMEPVYNDKKGFRTYKLAQHSIEMEKTQTIKVNGKDVEVYQATKVPVDAAKAVVAQGKGKYDEVSKNFSDYRNRFLRFLTDAQLVSEKQYKAFRATYDDYMPLRRVMDEDQTSGGGSSQIGVGKVIKARNEEGSFRQILDPVEQTIRDVYRLLPLAERNRMMLSLVKLLDDDPVLAKSLGVEKIDQNIKRVEANDNEMKTWLDKNGIEGNPDSIVLYRQEASLGPNEVGYRVDGQFKALKVSPLMAQAIKGMDNESMHPIIRWLGYFAKATRAGSVLTPDFMFRHLWRDQLLTPILSDKGYFSRDSYIPFYHAIEGFKSLMKQDSAFGDFVKGGGLNASMFEINRKYIDQDIFELTKKAGMADQAWNLVRSPLEMLHAAASVMMNSTRVGIYKNQMGKMEDAEINDIMSASFKARNTPIDYNRYGANTVVRAMSRMTAFWNDRTQGLDKLVTAFKDDPTGMSAKAFTAVTAPSIALWLLYHDDPRIKEAQQWQKDLYHLIPIDHWEKTDEDTVQVWNQHRPDLVRKGEDGGWEINEGTVLRIPRLKELGLIFGSFIERGLTAFKEQNPKAFEGMLKALFLEFSPGFIPNFSTPLFEQWAKKSFLTGNPLVPHNLEGVFSDLQYNDYSSPTAKVLSNILVQMPGLKDRDPEGIASPAILENYIRSWTGNLGNYALRAVDASLEAAHVYEKTNDPAWSLADMPIAKAFFLRNPHLGSQSIIDFRETIKRAAVIEHSIKVLGERGEVDKAYEEADKPENQAQMLKIKNAGVAFAKISNVIHGIWIDKNMDPVQKRQLIDGQLYGAIEIAKYGNELFKSYQDSLKEK